MYNYSLILILTDDVQADLFVAEILCHLDMLLRLAISLIGASLCFIHFGHDDLRRCVLSDDLVANIKR